MEGPGVKSIVDKLKIFIGENIIDCYGNTKKIDLEEIKNREIINIDSYGKLLLIYLNNGKILKIHFLMYGSYSINEKKDKKIRLALKFKKGELFLYNCSVNLVDKIEINYKDILDDNWDYKPVLEYLKNSDNYICDDLLNQKILPGVGNIIKVEGLFRSKINPESISKNIPEEKIIELLKNIRNFSIDFYNVRRYDKQLKDILLCYRKKNCYYCKNKIKLKKTGKKNRISFYCENCQIKY